MNNSGVFNGLKALNNNNVTTKSTPDSIRPVDVGGVTNAILDALLPITNLINSFDILGGSSAPTSQGNDGDIYIQDGLQLVFWKKVGDIWVSKRTVELGIQIVDGNINLQSRVSGFVVTVSGGQWGINNIIYTKAVQTELTLNPADANFDRIDAVFANTSNNITYTAGTASSNPDNTKPVTPANNVIVAYVYVPSVASGNLPYIADSNTPITPPSPGIETLTYTEANLVGNDTDGYTLPINDVPEDKIVVLPPIINKSGVVTKLLNIQPTDDYINLIGFPDNEPQTITIKLI